GKQIVIAGDEHQMPPSNYFSKIFDGSIDDEDDYEEDEQPVIDRDNILLSCESLLDFATELKFNKRFLDFHYRSKHPYLIDFSNYAFYNQRLIPLPNKFDYTPIKHIQVNGTYSDHANEKEADAVLSILENNINKLPNGKYPSVGIATFNIAQRNLIKSRILERRKFEKYREFNDKIQELEEEGLFVKNLENIQGDERDVIILSTTYGINQEGKFNQRFGPINHQKGYKLLNVIITRAKYKVYLCTSIPEKVYLDYKSYLVTENSNNRRAVFFAYLAYGKAVSENNHDGRKAILHDLAENSNAEKIDFSHNPEAESPFEEEVYQVLAANFDEGKIIQQLQFAGFRIDMVYDPEHPGLPKVAIECDGASYHSSREAYLYDRHRQKILEDHGFVFHRIWSTNWWRNPKRETEQLVNFIRSIENKNPELFETEQGVSDAFTDNIEIIRNELPFNDPDVQTDLLEEIDQIESHSLDTDELPKDDIERIKAFSKVKVNYLNNDKEIMVELVENGAVKPDNSNGLMKINIKTPLGQALLGKTKGETVKIGKLDNYVEIIEIINKN
ncbi:MAG: AAA domain-containing protein, partial [Melioribacteraceae bacterium]|nr:AAA domain-containing protein [Melioribacteraceae bacterium]